MFRVEAQVVQVPDGGGGAVADEADPCKRLEARVEERRELRPRGRAAPGRDGERPPARPGARKRQRERDVVPDAGSRRAEVAPVRREPPLLDGEAHADRERLVPRIVAQLDGRRRPVLDLEGERELRDARLHAARRRDDGRPVRLQVRRVGEPKRLPPLRGIGVHDREPPRTAGVGVERRERPHRVGDVAGREALEVRPQPLAPVLRRLRGVLESVPAPLLRARPPRRVRAVDARRVPVERTEPG